MSENVLLAVENLVKSFAVRNGRRQARALRAVDGVSFCLKQGTTMGLVGESGSGKTTTGRAILRLIEPDSGRILYRGADITAADMKPYRKKMQIIFQNPGGSLDPRCRVKDIVAEGLWAHGLVSSRAEEQERIGQLLADVGLLREDAQRYPGEFSGGQQQRIGIARAIAVDPEFIVCDEPVSALDVSYQAQIINMLERLQEERGLTYLFISHDLSVVMHISQTIGVMYRGCLVETGPCIEVVQHAAHPYTQMLLRAIPVPDPQKAKNRQRSCLAFDGEEEGKGCPFWSRCALRLPICAERVPKMREVAAQHLCACHLFGEK